MALIANSNILSLEAVRNILIWILVSTKMEAPKQWHGARDAPYSRALPASLLREPFWPGGEGLHGDVVQPGFAQAGEGEGDGHLAALGDDPV